MEVASALAEQLANNAAGTLSANMLIGATSLTLSAGQGAAFPSSGNFRILIGSELILVGARATDTLSSLTRGIEGTAAAAHTAGDAVTHITTAGGLQQFIRDNSVQSPVGVVSGEAAVYNGTTWVRSSVTGLAASGIAPGTNGQFLQTTGGVATWGTAPVVAPTHLPGAIANGDQANTLTANTAYLIPIPNLVIATPISRIAFRVGTASGNMDVGLYFSDDETTFTRFFSTGTFVVPATGLNFKAIATQTVTPVAGRRWYYALAADNATATFGVANPAAGTPAFPWGTYSKATSFVLPSSLTTVAVADGASAPMIHGAI